MPGGNESAPGSFSNQADAEILLEERDAAVHAFLEPRGLRSRVGCRRGVGVEADAIAEPAAEQLPARHAPGLAGKVHQGHLDAADAAGLPRRRAELLDAPEDLVDVARVLAEDPALQHQRVAFVAPVAHFAPADQPLVRIDRMMGTVKGAPVTTATRKSVIFSADGSDARLTFDCTKSAAVAAAASPVIAIAAPTPIPRRLQNDRRSTPGLLSSRSARMAGFMRSPPSDMSLFQGCDVDERLRIESVPRQVKAVRSFRQPESVPGSM